MKMQLHHLLNNKYYLKFVRFSTILNTHYAQNMQKYVRKKIVLLIDNMPNRVHV